MNSRWGGISTLVFTIARSLASLATSACAASRATSEPQVYLSYQQVPDGWIIGYTPKDLAIHSSQPPERLIPAVRRIIAAADPQQPISQRTTMEEIVAGETESRTIQMRVLITFTAIAILLAGLGIYGLLSFTVSLRQQEFGIRMALGARHGDIFTMVLRQGVVLARGGPVARAGACLCGCQIAAEPACGRETGRCVDILNRGRAVSDYHPAWDVGPRAACRPRRSYRRHACRVESGTALSLG